MTTLPETRPDTLVDESAHMWQAERPAAYDELAWVHTSSLIQPFVELADRGGIHVDLGTGTGTILSTLADGRHRSIGVDASLAMLNQVPSAAAGRQQQLLQADITRGLPLASESADLVTERMMLHDLRDPAQAIREAWRIVKPGGQLLFSEYVIDQAREPARAHLSAFNASNGTLSAITPESEENYTTPSPQVVAVLRELFALKHEPDRFLLTGVEFMNLILANCPGASDASLNFSLEDHSVANWLGKSGFPLPECKQLGLIACFGADETLQTSWGLRLVREAQPVASDFQGALLRRYQHSDSEQREAMQLDARFDAAFAFVSLRKTSRA